MIYLLCCIYDKLEKVYTSPFCCPNRDVACRMVKEQIASVPYPNDKQLFFSGWFNSETGKVSELSSSDGEYVPIDLSCLSGGSSDGEV